MTEWEKNRSVKKLKQLISLTKLNLEGISLYTEAATGYYSVIAALGIMAGAKSIHCVAKSSQYGSASEAISQTSDFLDYIPDVNRS